MGYQALLFCPDEKLARVVSQVFSELDFAVEPVHEPFAAVKKLMAQRYDAVVVDCENEQNASLLFKSARNSSFNQSSLAIALVEGQAGVAKAYRIGANLVLTKPINVEQAKGTLRVARGLLRKGSESASHAPNAAPASPRGTRGIFFRCSHAPIRESTRGAQCADRGSAIRISQFLISLGSRNPRACNRKKRGSSGSRSPDKALDCACRPGAIRSAAVRACAHPRSANIDKTTGIRTSFNQSRSPQAGRPALRKCNAQVYGSSLRASPCQRSRYARAAGARRERSGRVSGRRAFPRAASSVFR